MLRTLFKRVSGARALSLMAFLLFLPFGVLGVAIIIPQTEIRFSARLNWFFVGVIAQIVTAIAIIVFNLIYVKFFRKSKFSLLFVFSALFISGAIRGVAIGQVAPFFKLEDPVPPLIRAANSGITVVLWLGIIGLVLEAQASYVREYQDLYQRFLMLKSGRLPDGRALNSGRLSEIAEQVAEMTSPLRIKLAKMSEGNFSDAQVNEAVADLQRVVKEQIRPLSHRLWFDRTSHLLRFKFTHLFSDALRSKDISILFLTSFISLTILIGTAVNMEIKASLVVTLIFMFSLFSLLVAEKGLYATLKIRSEFLHPIILLLISTVPLVLTRIYFDFVQIPIWSLYANVGVAGSILICAILTTMLAQSLIDRSKIIDILTAQITSGYVEEHLLAIARMSEDSEIASYLHSSLQSELTAVALKLEQAVRTGDSETVKNIIEYAQIVMARDLTVNFHAGENSPLERVESLVKSWQGIAEIKLSLPEIELCEKKVITEISQIIEEAVSDSVRFGNANLITITGGATPDHYYLKVTDNGTSKKESGSGLGTILLDDIAPNLWRRQFALGETNLEIWIPTR